jgi:hypothetical protein
MSMNLRYQIPKVPNILAKTCLCVVFYLWLAEVFGSSTLHPGTRCLMYLTQVVLCGIAAAANSKQVAILGGVFGCMSLFLFIREYMEVLHHLKLKRELDVFYQTGR